VLSKKGAGSDPASRPLGSRFVGAYAGGGMSTATYSGFVCLGPRCEQYGFILTRKVDGSLPELVASRFSWPVTDDGRVQAAQHMQRLIDRERLAEHWPNASVYDVVFEG